MAKPGIIMRHDALSLVVDHERAQTNLRHASIHRRILVVAKHRFARFSFDETSLEDIARSADVTEAELRLHFDDKLSILMAVLNDGWEVLNPRLADIVLNSLTARAAMLSMLAFMANLIQQDEDFVRLVLFEGRRPDPASSEMSLSNGYRRFMQTFGDLVARGQKDGSFGPGDHPRVIASMLVGAIEGIIRDRLIAEQMDGVTPYTGRYLMSAFDSLVSSLEPCEAFGVSR